MKLGLIKLENEKIVGVKYMESKFDRELGFTYNIDGIKWRVGIIADTRNEVIIALNDIIREINSITRKANSITRKDNKIENKKANIMFAQITNKIYKDLILTQD